MFQAFLLTLIGDKVVLGTGEQTVNLKSSFPHQHCLFQSLPQRTFRRNCASLFLCDILPPWARCSEVLQANTVAKEHAKDQDVEGTGAAKTGLDIDFLLCYQSTEISKEIDAPPPVQQETS